jgi:alkanesulfonate monooxygenase SsuD/methylene tetrahydromethanopterin reductase-like flavin-dependent oxidoreductase (luciferase family)
MRLGLIHINMGPMSRPDALVQAARAAEQAGFDSVWAGEHLVLPDPQVPPSPMAPQDPALDSLLALTWAAAHTATIRLATGIVILPQRNPVLLAKQVATLDVLSGGRVMLGVGAGYLEPEFRGRFASFGGVDAHPRPVQRPIPLVVGGHSAPAYRRAVARAHGWYGYWLTPAQAAESLAGLASAAAQVRRPAELGELEISLTPRGRMTAERAAEFATLGVHRLVLLAPPDPDGPALTIEAGIAAVAGLR